MVKKLVIGVDLGGTNIKAGLVDSSGSVLERLSIPSEANLGGERIVENICTAARNVAENAGWDSIETVGIGSPGPLDYRTGVIFNSPNLPGLEGVSLSDEVGKRLEVQVFVENDANAACWGEYWVGAGKGLSSMVLLTLGTGIGGGIILENRLWRGITGSGAELGHMVIDCDGELCGCGNRGCLEAYASAPATVRRFLKMVEGGAKTSIPNNELQSGAVTADMLHSAATAGDETARSALEETGRRLGIGVANIANILNPEAVLFSGGLAGAADIILPAVRKEVFERAFDVVTKDLRIDLCTVPDDAGIIGAAGCALERIKGNE